MLKLPINKIGRPRSGSPICLIMSMITERVEGHEGLLPINHNLNKICDTIGYFSKSKPKKFQILFASGEKKAIYAGARWRVLSNYLGMTRTALLNCPSKAKIANQI